MSEVAPPNNELNGDSVRTDQSNGDAFNWIQFNHYLHAPLRRPLVALVPLASILLLSIGAFYVLPKRYKSLTLILVESEKVPESFVARVATEDRNRRLDAVRPEVLSRTRLEKVLEETRPYPNAASAAQAMDLIRRSIAINNAGNDGFTIEFVHSDPYKARQVADRLATLFIEETGSARQQQVEGAVDFLVTQVKDARTELEKKDEALRRYKEVRMGSLPEQLQTNLATMGMLQQEMRTVEESLFFAAEKRDTLARRAARTSGDSPPSSPPPGTDLDDLRRQLAALRSRYTDEHPDVQRLRSSIVRLEARLAATAGDAAETDRSLALAREQLESARLDVQKLEDKRADLERRLTLMRARVEETPRTEQELANLTRDYKKLNENYSALLSKQLEAQMAGRLEERWKGDRFRVLDPANLPEKPYFPRASLIVGFGAVLGLIVGLGASLLAEFLDPSIKDVQELEALLSFPVLARIPHLRSTTPGTR